MSGRGHIRLKKASLGFLVAGAAIAIFFAFAFRTHTEDNFPYGQSSLVVQIHRKENPAAMGQRSYFQLSADGVEGEAVFTPVPSAKAGEAMVQSLIFGVTSAFQERPAPYAGQITAQIACDAKKYVSEGAVFFAAREAKLVKAVASGRKIYGSCSAEEIKFASLFFAGFDESRAQVVAVKLFKLVKDASEIVPAQEEQLKILRQVIGQP